MAVLSVQTNIESVPAGTYFVRVELLDVDGHFIDDAASGPIEIPAGENLAPDVKIPTVQIRGQAGTKVRPVDGPPPTPKVGGAPITATPKPIA